MKQAQTMPSFAKKGRYKPSLCESLRLMEGAQPGDSPTQKRNELGETGRLVTSW